MKTHEIDVMNLIPVKPFECFIVRLEHKENKFVLKTYVGDLVELKKVEEEVYSAF